jgi:hypothetical protein
MHVEALAAYSKTYNILSWILFNNNGNIPIRIFVVVLFVVTFVTTISMNIGLASYIEINLYDRKKNICKRTCKWMD